jgi:hypothetical protein
VNDTSSTAATRPSARPRTRANLSACKRMADVAACEPIFGHPDTLGSEPPRSTPACQPSGNGAVACVHRRHPLGRNPGDVWAIPTRPYSGPHFAAFLIAGPTRCIQAGCKPGGLVLDPFCGTATAGLAALSLGRRFTGIELSPRSPPWRPNDSATSPSLPATPGDRPPAVIVNVYVSRASARKERAAHP